MFGNSLQALIRTLRPRQWAKNSLLFAALVFDRQLTLSHLPAILHTVAGFIFF
jgi:4-hydroxybenzoate polyprenyltransferase